MRIQVRIIKIVNKSYFCSEKKTKSSEKMTTKLNKVFLMYISICTFNSQPWTYESLKIPEMRRGMHRGVLLSNTISSHLKSLTPNQKNLTIKKRRNVQCSVTKIPLFAKIVYFHSAKPDDHTQRINMYNIDREVHSIPFWVDIHWPSGEPQGR